MAKPTQPETKELESLSSLTSGDGHSEGVDSPSESLETPGDHLETCSKPLRRFPLRLRVHDTATEGEDFDEFYTGEGLELKHHPYLRLLETVGPGDCRRLLEN